MVNRLPRKKIWLFRCIALLLPFLLLLLVEMGLRLFHYGYDPSLFIEDPANPDHWVMNPAASRKYFTDQLNATTGNIEPFPKVKGPNTLRFFVLGESTTIGYPYFHNGSFHRWLQYRLMRTFPDKQIEVVNVSLTAVNSYTVLGFAKEVVSFQPDAVLIYTGHNEYYGALGVGSTNQLGGSPALVNMLLSLRELRVVQLLTRMLSAFSSGGVRSGKTRMESMVANQQIAYGSKAFYRGIDQFRYNMDRTLALFERAKVPVFLSDLVWNEKDLRPFVGGADMYERGRAAYDRGNFAAAAKWLDYAKELDALRFRAPDSINRIIVQLARKYQIVQLVDTRSAFAAASAHGLIGDELLLEHVHPNLNGYAILSDVFYKAMRGILPAGKEMSLGELRAEMPVTVVDSLNGAYRIAHLKRSWPFADSAHAIADIPTRELLGVSSAEQELGYAMAFEHLPWEEAMSRLYADYSRRGDWKGARTVMEGLVLEHPEESDYWEKTAMLCGRSKEFDKAIFYFDEAFRRNPSFERAHYLFVLCLQQDRPDEAIPYLDYAIGHNERGLELGAVRSGVMEVIRLRASLAKAPGNVQIGDSIAHIYEKMGNKEAAERYKGHVRP